MSESLFFALKKRNVFKIGAAYLVLAWIVVQITTIAVPALHLPLWVNSLVFFLGLLGFPIALFFAWAFEMTPQSIKHEDKEISDDSLTAQSGRKLIFLIIGLLIAASAYVIYESPFADSAAVVKQADKSVSGASIAVLPFRNMSSDSEQEYFADGISEEILNVLAQVPKLHVTSRSSAFAFKDKDINLPEVATTLGVDNILEGSVRKSAGKIRITAQLIEAASDKHLWSATYDRELIDVFAVQDEISSAIVTALKEKLGLNASIPTRDTPKINVEAHNEYLKGRHLIVRRTSADIETALTHFIKATELEPLYDEAWTNVALAQALLGENQYGQTPRFMAFEQANIAIDKALAINSELSSANAVKGMIHQDIDEVTAKKFLTKAIKLDNSNAQAYGWLAYLLRSNGQYEQGFLALEKAVKLDPLSVFINANYAHFLAARGYLTQAEQQVAKMVALNTNNPRTYEALASIRRLQNRHGEAVWLLQKSMQLSQGERLFFTYNWASMMRELNMGETAAAALTNSPFSFITPFALNQWDKHTAMVRAIFPRNNNDITGLSILGETAAAVGEYAAAVKWFDAFVVKWSDKSTTDYRASAIEMYSYLNVEDKTQGNQYLTVALAELAREQQSGLSFDSTYPAELSYLQGNIDKAIAILETTIDGGAVLNVNFRYYPMYDALRAHPNWPALLVKSELTVVKQQAIYWQLSQQDASITDVLARPKSSGL